MYTTNEMTDIAIIGMAGRFPGANTPNEFWENLKKGLEMSRVFNNEELLAEGVPEEHLYHPEYKKIGMMVNDIENFDAEFFGFTPHEAKITDPQHRIFLECVWEGLEDAGYSPSKYDGRIGLFGSTSMSTYLLNNILPNEDILRDGINYPILIGNDKDFLCTKIAYKLNLKGPSVTIQTACSSSLVGIHQGVQSILNGESDLAIAGGVSISVPQGVGYLYKEGGILSREGHCKPFDENANGTIKGNGCGVIVMKSLSEAIRDQDHIYAVIKSTAINNDGSNKVGFSAPSIKGQENVIREAIYLANIDHKKVGYIEAHGTGTSLGDPIEIQALNRAYGNNEEHACAIGSVKANIGHTDAAAGVIGVIKTALSLKNQTIVPTPNYKSPNKNLQLEKTPFYIADRLEKKELQYAGVSSFGIGGTNAHVILGHFNNENTPNNMGKHDINHPENVFLLSAKTKGSLDQMKNMLRKLLTEDPDLTLEDVAYTLAVGRTNFSYRYFTTASSREELIKKLAEEDHYTDNQVQNPAFELGYNEEFWREILINPAFSDILQEVLVELNKIDPAITEQTLMHERWTKYFTYNLILAKKIVQLGVSPELIVSHNKIEDLVLFVVGEVLTIEEAIMALHNGYLKLGDLRKRKSIYPLLCSDGKFYKEFSSELLTSQMASINTVDTNHLLSLSDAYEPICFTGISMSGISSRPNMTVFERFLNVLGRIWGNGIDIDLSKIILRKKRLSLPTYPFDKKRYWIDGKKSELSLKHVKSGNSMNIEKVVIETWKKHLEIDDVSLDDNYYDLGGDSLTAVEIVSELRDLLKVTITIDQFTDMETPNDLITFINEQKKEKLNIKNVTQIRVSNNSSNLFLIHPAGGNNICYTQMNRFIEDLDKNIYVISYPENRFRNESLEEISRHYVKLIETIQPEGEYELGGYSFGGNVAFEMAIQLQEKNKRVKSVIMFDTHTPEAYYGQSISDDYFVRAFPLVIDMYLTGGMIDFNLLEQYANRTFDEIVNEMLKKRSLSLTKKDVETFFNIWKHNHNALKTYYPNKKFAGDLLYFEAEEQESGEVLDLLKIKRVAKKDWLTHIEGEITLIKVNGNHYTMFGDTNKVKELAHRFEEHYSKNELINA